MTSFRCTLWEKKSQVAKAIEGARRYFAENSAREEISTAVDRRGGSVPSFVRAEATLGRDSSGAGQRKANISMADVCVSPWRKHATRPSASIASFIEKVD